jgi:hypothetical protein
MKREFIKKRESIMKSEFIKKRQSHEEKINLTDQQRFAAYFALTVIESKDGQVQKRQRTHCRSLEDKSKHY